MSCNACKDCHTCNSTPAATQAVIEKHISSGHPALVPVVDQGFMYTVGMTELFKVPELIFFDPYHEEGSEEWFLVGASLFKGIINKLKTKELDRESFDRYEIQAVNYIVDERTKESVKGYLGCLPVDPLFETMSVDTPLGEVVRRYGAGKFEVRQIFLAGRDRLLPWHIEARPSPERGQTCRMNDDQLKAFHALCELTCSRMGCMKAHTLMCRECNVLPYCSTECQRLDKKRHKNICPLHREARSKYLRENGFSDPDVMD